jgi:hypothetical protein
VLTFVLHLCAYLVLIFSDLGTADLLTIVSALTSALAPALALVGLHVLSKMELASQTQ